jgi:hypothetical protein
VVALEAVCLILVEEMNSKFGKPEQQKSLLFTARIGNYRTGLFSFCVREYKMWKR